MRGPCRGARRRGRTRAPSLTGSGCPRSCCSRPRCRTPPPAGRSLAPLIKKLDAQFGRGAGALEPRWVEIVGERLARVTRPQKLTKGRGGAGGTLELRVAGPAALLVQHQSEDIIQRVNLFLGAGHGQGLHRALGDTQLLDRAGA